MKYHQLKTWPTYFEAIWDGRKRFEHRRDDRGFREGDVLILREWDPDTEQYSGREFSAKVTYIFRVPSNPADVIMSIDAYLPPGGDAELDT